MGVSSFRLFSPFLCSSLFFTYLFGLHCIKNTYITVQCAIPPGGPQGEKHTRGTLPLN